MSDSERFKDLKQKVLSENEQKYGDEIRALYGEDEVQASNARFAGLTEEQYSRMEDLSRIINEALVAAVPLGDPFSEDARLITQMHKEWLCFFWKDYSPEKHIGVAQMYVADERFAEFYESVVAGAAEYIRDAIEYWAAQM